MFCKELTLLHIFLARAERCGNSYVDEFIQTKDFRGKICLLLDIEKKVDPHFSAVLSIA